jgi:lipopolysaccharide biosynthesis regulator YciM
VGSWRKIVNESPGLAYVTFKRLEQAYFDQGTFSEMVELYDGLLERDPRNIRALLAKAKIHERKGEEDAALDALRRAGDADPNSLAGAVALLERHARVGDVGAAISQARSLVGLLQGEDDLFRCSLCGHETSEILWRCPKCRQWETFLSGAM